jgi:hypothetical protein
MMKLLRKISQFGGNENPHLIRNIHKLKQGLRIFFFIWPIFIEYILVKIIKKLKIK